MHTIREEVRQGFSSYDVVTVGTHHPGEADMLTDFHANGYLQSPASLKWYAENHVRQAQEQNIPYRMVLYQSPNSYGFGDHFDRYFDVVKRGLRDRPVVVSGISWGWQHALTAAELLHAEGLPVHSAQGVAPNSLTPLTFSLGSLATDLPRLIKGARREAKAYDLLLYQEGIKYDGPQTRGVRRLMRHLIDSTIEGADILTRDNTQRTADLNNKLGIFTTIAAGTGDLVCPHDLMYDNLDNKGFPMAQFMTMETCHVGAAIQRKHVPRLFAASVMRTMVAHETLMAA